MGTIRIVSGRLKGRRIHVSAGLVVRPTSEKAREALFDILGETVLGARVLDAYAGTGALGFEALSRGARSVTFIESDRKVLEVLIAAAAALGLSDQCRIVAGRANLLLRQGGAPGPFDLVVADPPYAEPSLNELLTALAVPGLLAPDARVVLERDAKVEPARPASSPLQRVRTARYGRTCLDFYRHRTE